MTHIVLIPIQAGRLMAVALFVTLTAFPAAAGTVLDRVRAHGSVRCGAFERPGLAIEVREAQAAAADSVGQTPDQTPWHGLTVDVCKAVALAVLGSADKIEFHGYDGADDLAGLANGEDDIAFLTGREMHQTGVTGRVIPGPVVFVESLRLMLPDNAGPRHLADVDGDKGVCFENGSPVEHLLPAYFSSRQKSWLSEGYTEEGEMIDVYNVHRCLAMAAESTHLAMIRLQRGVNNVRSVILPEPLATFPVMATTGVADGQWSAIVGWTMATLIAGDRASSDYSVGGAAAMPVAMPDAALAKDWQASVLSGIGSYRAIYERNLGTKSDLKLEPNLNDSVDRGGLIFGPIFE